MADDFVDGGADAFGEAVIAKLCEFDAFAFGELPLQVVDILGAHAWGDLRDEPSEAFGGFFSGDAHALDIFFGFEDDARSLSSEHGHLGGSEGGDFYGSSTGERICRNAVCAIVFS